MPRPVNDDGDGKPEGQPNDYAGEGLKGFNHSTHAMPKRPARIEAHTMQSRIVSARPYDGATPLLSGFIDIRRPYS
jgi:hypothetical protein